MPCLLPKNIGNPPLKGIDSTQFKIFLPVFLLISLRLIIGDFAMLEATHRGYYISDVASAAPRGNETIGHLNLGLTVRILGPHALEVQCLLSGREGHYDGMANQRQGIARVALLYTFLSDTHFGAVEWRQSH